MPIVILQLLAEGGSLTLFGRQDHSGNWSFTLEAYDCSDDDDFKSSEWQASSWPEALVLLDRFPYWPLLHLRALHPEFESRLLEEALRRGGDAAVRRWREDQASTWPQ